MSGKDHERKRKRSSSHSHGQHDKSRSRSSSIGSSRSDGSKSKAAPAKMGFSFGGFKIAKPKLTRPAFGGFSLGKKAAAARPLKTNVFAAAADAAERKTPFGSTSPTGGQSKEEKFRLRRERLAQMMKRKKEEEALAAMSEEERKRHEREKKLEQVRKEIEAKDRAFAEAEAARKRELERLKAAKKAHDPLDQFMQQLHKVDSGAADGAAGITSREEAAATIAPAPRKVIPTISFDDIVKAHKISDRSTPAATTQNSGGIADSGEDSDGHESDTVEGGSFLDAIEGGVAAQNVALENQADGEVSEDEVDDDTFYAEFRKEWARRSEAERRRAEANRLEEEKQRELEEKERIKQEKAQEGLGVIYGDAEVDGAAYQAQQGKSALEILREKMMKKELKKVDHSAVEYLAIRKSFYREHPNVSKMEPTAVKALLRKLEIKVRGKNAPKPLTSWAHAGLDVRILTLLQKFGFEAPFAIQAMAIPALMSGRDIIGVAKTGSGKTLAFLLPLFRHVLDQPKLADGEGPIGLVMAPARELAVQIYRETKKFSKVLDMRTVAVYGGSAVSEQINAMKRGAEIVVATPGRFIDLLTLNAGKLISLSRVSYLVLDEADRMFDMGFEPQIAMVTKNIRPDRQTAMFSATFPSHVERLARKLLRYKPLEIIVGGRSKVASEIEQFVEIRNDKQKFLRLLQILGLWHGKGSVLIFTDTQALCDKLYSKLMRAGYYCLSLHSGKDQTDRDQTISDFKNKTRDIMVATSLAGRGLDVKSLTLVVNYSCPNHLEDYVQRCGRTGRAGNKGTAYTFIDPATEEQFVPDVVKALNESAVDVPQPVLDLQAQFLAKVKAGTAKKAISGYKGKGHKFDADEAGDVAVEKEIQKMRHEVGAGIRDAGELVEAEEQLRHMRAEKEQQKAKSKQSANGDDTSAGSGDASANGDGAKKAQEDPAEEAKLRAQIIAQRVSSGGSMKGFDLEAAVRAAKMARSRSGRTGPGGPRLIVGDNGSESFEDELEINDYPAKARLRVLQRDTIQTTQDFTNTAIISKGIHIPHGRKPKEGEQKLYLLIQGSTAINVKRAKADLLRVLEEVTMEVGFDKSMIAGKYTVT